MADQRQAALEYARQHQTNFLSALKEIVAIPSISTDDEHKPQMQQAAEWMAARLKSLGMQRVAVMPTSGHPIVYGEWLGAAGKPVVLIYGHYDVQPVDPLDQWKTPPFTATEVGENLFARGTSDMKGQVVAVFSAVEALLAAGELPVNLKFLLEGEEEVGSPALDSWIPANQELLQTDFCLNPDAGMLGKNYPTITYGLRGLAYFELRLYGPDHDLHSGLAGGVVHNPAQALAELIAGMHDPGGRVTLPGFYDSVRPLSPEEHANFVRLPEDEAEYLRQTGVPALWGEADYLPVERVGARPTLEINGLLSGFTDKGQKTVIPATSMAKISCRLVPDQDPQQVHEQLKRYLETKAPATVHWELDLLSGSPASISDMQQSGVTALAKALETVWGTPPLFRREGGSIPVVGQMQSVLGLESVLTGFGLPDDNLHAPNEKLHLPTWYRGIEALVHFFLNL